MNNPFKKSYPSFFYTVLFFSLLSIFFNYLAFLFHISPSKLFEAVLNLIFLPRFNMCEIGLFHNINILGLYNLFLVLTVFICITLTRRKTPQDKTVVIRTVLILGISLFAIIQQFSRNNYFQEAKLIFAHKTIREKYTFLYGPAYTFVEQCRANLKGRHQGKLISDQDLTQDYYSSLQRFLAYQLYPTISVRFNNNTPDDSLILFFKNNPFQSIPESYKPLIATTMGELILTVKKKHE